MAGSRGRATRGRRGTRGSRGGFGGNLPTGTSIEGTKMGHTPDMGAGMGRPSWMEDEDEEDKWRRLGGKDRGGGKPEFDLLGHLGGPGALANMLRGLLRGEGGGDDDPMAAFETPGRWSGESTIPDEWEAPETSAPRVNPEEVIRSQEPRIQEQLNKYAAQSAARLGQLGAVGSGYAKSLGEQARRGTKDIGEIIAKYSYGAAENAAQREFKGDQAAASRDLSAWGKHGGWEFGGDQADLARSLQEHGMAGDWEMDAQRSDRDQLRDERDRRDRYQDRDRDNMFSLITSLLGVGG